MGVEGAEAMRFVEVGGEDSGEVVWSEIRLERREKRREQSEEEERATTASADGKTSGITSSG